jgi:Flp pilus assembly protein TadG
VTKLRNRLQGSSPGQTVIFFALMMTLMASFGALAIDVGLIVNERRDAQNDVDKAALAGAQELTLEPGSIGTDTTAATLAAEAWAASNGVDTSDPEIRLDVNVVYNCFSNADPVPTGVQVTVSRPAPSMFVRVLGLTNWEATATATACTGVPIEASGFMPWAVSEVSSCFQEQGTNADGSPRYVPIWEATCDIVIDSNVTGLHGELGLDRNLGAACDDGNGSASVLEDNIVYGGIANCTIDVDSVEANAGHNTGPAHDGLETRLSADGGCDLDGNYTDDFDEIFLQIDADSASPYRTYCSSPRDITLIVVHDWANPENEAGNNTYLVRGFMRMYLDGCVVEQPGSGGGETFYPLCDFNGNGKFTVRATMVNAVQPSASLGLDADFGEPVVFLKH